MIIVTSIPLTQASYAQNMRCTGHNTPNGPIDSTGNKIGGSQHLRCLRVNVLRGKLMELDNVIGYIQHCLEKVVNCLKLWSQIIHLLQCFMDVLQLCNRLSKTIGGMKLSHQPKLLEVCC